MTKLVIGIDGEKRGGKGTFVEEFIKLAPQNTVTHHRFSDILYETLRAWGIETTRENLQQLSIAMKKTFGNGTLMRAVKTRAERAQTPVVILDGVRWFEDESLIRNFPTNRLLYITAFPRLRYERSLKSAEKAGENTATYEEFLVAEKAETEIYIQDIGSRADIRIDNNGSYEAFLEKIAKVYEALKPLIEMPR